MQSHFKMTKNKPGVAEVCGPVWLSEFNPCLPQENQLLRTVLYYGCGVCCDTYSRWNLSSDPPPRTHIKAGAAVQSTCQGFYGKEIPQKKKKGNPPEAHRPTGLLYIVQWQTAETLLSKTRWKMRADNQGCPWHPYASCGHTNII